MCPPWCVTVRVIGHSFQPGREHFIPRFSLQRPRVVSTDIAPSTVLTQSYLHSSHASVRTPRSCSERTFRKVWNKGIFFIFIILLFLSIQVFPALSLVSYRTVLLENMGDLPLVFRLDPEECPSVSVQPTSGLVQPGHHQILTLRTTPAEDCPAKLPLTLHFNASPKHTQVPQS